MKVNMKMAALAVAAMLILKPAFADMPVYSTMAEYLAAGYSRVESLDILLLTQQRAGLKLDQDKLLEAAGDGLSGTLRQRYEKYKNSKDAAARFELTQLIGFELQDRQAAVNQAKGYIVPLDVTLDNFDSARGGLPLHLSLDIYPTSGRQDFQCAGIKTQLNMAGCVSGGNLTSGDPVFDLLPIPNPELAAQVKGLIDSKRWAIYAVGALHSTYQIGESLPSDLSRRGVVGNQPMVITGLLLVNIQDNKVLNTAQAQAPQDATPKTTFLQKPEAQKEVSPLFSPTGGGTSTTVSYPPVGDPPPPGNTLPSPTYGPVGQGPIPPSDQPTALDKLLSWLAYTVYATPTQVAAAERELQDLELKYSRIENDTNRNAIIQPLELKKLSRKIETQRLKLTHLQSMMEYKQQIPEKFGVQRLDAPIVSGITYERYRLPDAREVVVFRGTSGAQDYETDFQLAMTPETVAELTQGLGEGRSMALAFANKVSNGQNPENEGKPAAFLAADRLIANIIRSGFPANKLILTGHSLGGGLAQYAGIHQGVNSIVTFNTAPLNIQLRHSLETSKYTGAIRNYVSLIPSVTGESVMDPVSQNLGSKSVNSLQVIGPQYTVEVCNDPESPEFKSFSDFAQGFITRKTVSSMAGDKYKIERNAASAVGATAGSAQASTDNVSAGYTGYKQAKGFANGVVATMNCIDHPFLCSAKAVAGGVASISADIALSKLWALYTAHRMQGIFDAMNGRSGEFCHRN